MERSFSIRYRGAPSVPPVTSRTGGSAFDSATDTDIFALGDAAQDAGFSNFDIPDDIFKDFGLSWSSPSSDVSVPIDDETEDGETKALVCPQNIKVATISKTMADGRQVKTRIIQVI